jgi:S-DNA-T family DNA segregation ATPase FtsK/SpoIIIE
MAREGSGRAFGEGGTAGGRRGGRDGGTVKRRRLSINKKIQGVCIVSFSAYVIFAFLFPSETGGLGRILNNIFKWILGDMRFIIPCAAIGISYLIYFREPTPRTKRGVKNPKPAAPKTTLASALDTTARRISKTFFDFDVKAWVIKVVASPTVTTYQVKLGAGEKVNKVYALEKELRSALGVDNIQIDMQDGALLVRLPNKKRKTLLYGDLKNSAKKLTEVPIGISAAGGTIIEDLTKFPHALIGGATNSGKSTFINTVICSLIEKSSPEEIQFALVDPKLVEFSVYNNMPHLFAPIACTVNETANVLNKLVKEMLSRASLFKENGARNIAAYNAKTRGKLSYIVLIIDEIAELMSQSPDEIKPPLKTLFAQGRFAGIHILAATQNPLAKTMDSDVKANSPTRIAFQVAAAHNSMTILDVEGAEKLAGKGDMLLKSPLYPVPLRIQGAYISDEDIEDITESAIREYGTYESFDEEETPDLMYNVDSAAAQEALNEKKLEQREDLKDIRMVMGGAIETGLVSISIIKKLLGVGSSKATRLFNKIKDLGVLEYEGDNKPWRIKITLDEWDKMRKEIS